MVALIDRVYRCRLSYVVVFILVALSVLVESGTAQTRDQNPFVEDFSYINNKRMGERLSVSFPVSPTETTQSTEITIREEGFYNQSLGRFDKRMVAIVTGMGLGSTGLKVVIEDQRQINMLAECLGLFIQTYDYYLSYRDDIKGKTEDWMGESWQALGKGRPLGDVYFYPSKKPLQAEFNWDFELDRVWLSMGSRTIVSHEVVPYIHHMVQRLDAYKKSFFEFRETMKSKNNEIDALLGIDPH